LIFWSLVPWTLDLKWALPRLVWSRLFWMGPQNRKTTFDRQHVNILTSCLVETLTIKSEWEGKCHACLNLFSLFPFVCIGISNRRSYFPIYHTYIFHYPSNGHLQHLQFVLQSWHALYTLVLNINDIQSVMKHLLKSSPFR
jgi:hypothetical protein